MNKKIVQNYTQLAQGIGFSYDEPSNTIYGTRNGYEILIYATDQRYPYLFTISTSARSQNGNLSKDEIATFKKSVAPATMMTQKDSVITVTNKSQGNQSKLRDDINYILDALTAFLRERNFTTCCQTCSKSTQTVGFMLQSARMHLCSECASRAKSENEVKLQARQQKNSNIIGGIIGALLGSLVGVLCIVILGQLGYVAAISGIVMAFCTLKGFDKLSGKLTVPGIIISCIVMVAMTYIGNRVDWAIFVSKELEVGLLESYQTIPYLVEMEMLENYTVNLVQLYLFTVVGAVPTIISALKDQKLVNRVAQIGYASPMDAFGSQSSGDSE